ncbi:MAG: class I SAM-dependent methyltransferase [Hyphomonadaceae bacterium]|nr:class I SAM-dependent methyltransferase [Hyphomonadaceae bacterium]
MAHVLTRLSLAIRKRLPGPVRRVLRFGRHLFTAPAPSPPLPQGLVEQCRVCASREDLLLRLPKGGRIAEVGVETGAFSRRILQVAEPRELHLIDLDFSRIDAAVRADPRAILHKAPSSVAIASFPDDHFDWIYIDADHSYPGVRRDIEAAAAKVAPGGYLVFNDFAHIDPGLGLYGVHRAVVEFALARSWPFAWFVYHPTALYDVALRRP